MRLSEGSETSRTQLVDLVLEILIELVPLPLEALEPHAEAGINELASEHALRHFLVLNTLSGIRPSRLRVFRAPRWTSTATGRGIEAHQGSPTISGRVLKLLVQQGIPLPSGVLDPTIG